jgi:hypothetical protein
MAHDFEDAINLDHLTDGDVRDLIRQQLDEAEAFDVDAVDIEVVDGRIRVEGRVGTDEERSHVEQVLSALGAVNYDNNVVVDPNARASRHEAADMARLEEASADDPLGDPGGSTSDTAEHLRPDARGEMHGTRDMQKAIEEGKSYNPPEGPLQEGIGEGERH